MRKYQVWYLCHDCGGRFFLMQGDDEPDEDVCICWDCIDKMLGRESLSLSSPPAPLLHVPAPAGPASPPELPLLPASPASSAPAVAMRLA